MRKGALLAVLLGPSLAWGQNAPVSEVSKALQAARARYEQGPRSAGDLVAYAETLATLQAPDADEAELKRAAWLANQDLYRALDGISRQASSALQQGRSDFESADWKLLSSHWERLPASVRDTPLDLREKGVDRLFALMAALKNGKIDLSKTSPAVRRMIVDGGSVGPLGARLLAGGLAPATIQSLDAALGDPRELERRLDKLFENDPGGARALGESLSEAVRADASPAGGSLTGSRTGLYEPPGSFHGATQAPPAVASAAAPPDVLDASALNAKKALYAGLGDPAFGPLARAANKARSDVLRQELAQSRALLLRSDLGALSDPQAKAMLDRYAAIARAPQAERAQALARWNREAEAWLPHASGSLAAQERALADAYAQSKDKTKAEADLKAFYDKHPELRDYYRQRAEFQKFNLEAARAGRLPDGTSFAPEDLGVNVKPGSRLLLKAVDGKPGLLAFDAKDPNEARFESFDGRLVTESRRAPEGRLLLITRRFDAGGRPQGTEVSITEKDGVERLGSLDAKGRFVPSEERSADGKTTRVWLRRSDEAAFKRSGLANPSEAKRLAFFLNAQPKGAIEGVPLLQRAQDGGAGLVYQSPGQPPATHWVTMRKDGAVDDTALGPEGKATSATLLHYDAQGVCTVRETYRATTVETYDPNAPGGWYQNFRTGTRTRVYGARVKAAAVDYVMESLDPATGGYRVVERRQPKSDNLWDEMNKELSSEMESPLLKPVAYGTDFIANRGKDLGHGFYGAVEQSLADGGDKDLRVDRLVDADVSLFQAPAMSHVDRAPERLMGRLKKDLSQDDYASFRALAADRYRRSLQKVQTDVQAAAALDRGGSYQPTDKELGEFLISGQGGLGLSGAGNGFANMAQEADSIAGRTGFFAMATLADAAELAPQMLAFEAAGIPGARLGRAAEAAEAGRAAKAGNALFRAPQLAQEAYFKGMMAQQALQLGSAHNDNAYANFAEIAALAVTPSGDRERQKKASPFEISPSRMLVESLTTNPLAGAAKAGYNGVGLARDLLNGLRDPQLKLFRKGWGPVPERPAEEPPPALPPSDAQLPFVFPEQEPAPEAEASAHPLAMAAVAAAGSANSAPTPVLQAPGPSQPSGSAPTPAAPSSTNRLGGMVQSVQDTVNRWLGRENPETVAADNRRLLQEATERLAELHPGENRRLDGITPEAKAQAGLGDLPKARLKGILSTRGSTAVLFDGEVTVDGAKREAAIKVAVDKPGHAADGHRSRVAEIQEELAAHRKMVATLPPGLAPASFGLVDVEGNPALSMEKIRGKSLGDLTAEEVSLIGRRQIDEVLTGVQKLREAGLAGFDSPQLMMLTEDQVINGVRRRRGDVVFVDAKNVAADENGFAQTPQDMAGQLLKAQRAVQRFGATAPPDATVDQILEQAHVDLWSFAKEVNREAQALKVPQADHAAIRADLEDPGRMPPERFINEFADQLKAKKVADPEIKEAALRPETRWNFLLKHGITPEEIGLRRGGKFLDVERAKEIRAQLGLSVPQGTLETLDGGRAAKVNIPKEDGPSQDAVHVDSAKRVVIVADGMGGYAAGDKVSVVARDAAARHLEAALGPATTPEEAQAAVKQALIEAHNAVLDWKRENPTVPSEEGPRSTHESGTTLSIGVVVKDAAGKSVLVTANVGDSGIGVRRANGKFDVVTRENSATAIAREELIGELHLTGYDYRKIKATGWIDKNEVPRVLDIMSRAHTRDNLIVSALARARDAGKGFDLTRYYETHGINADGTRSDDSLRRYVSNTIGVGFNPDEADVRQTAVGPGDIVAGMTDGIIDNLGQRRLKAVGRVSDTPTALVEGLAAQARRTSTAPKNKKERVYQKADDISASALLVAPEEKAAEAPRPAQPPDHNLDMLGGAGFNKAMLEQTIGHDGHTIVAAVVDKDGRIVGFNAAGKLPEDVRQRLASGELRGVALRTFPFQDGTIDGIEARGLSWEESEALRQAVEEHNRRILDGNPALAGSKAPPSGIDLYLGASRAEAERRAWTAANPQAVERARLLSVMAISTRKFEKAPLVLDREAAYRYSFPSGSFVLNLADEAEVTATRLPNGGVRLDYAGTDGAPAQSVTLRHPGEQAVIGREAQIKIDARDKAVSRQHATVILGDGDMIYLRDESTHGTAVSARPTGSTIP